MENVLDVYKQPYDPDYPVVCMDESSKQHTLEVRKPKAAEPGKPARYDTEYKRNGVSNIFVFFEPLAGWRKMSVTDTRTAVDWAHQVKTLLDEDYPEAIKVKLVMDNLNTHTPASLYKAFEPKEARRLIERLECHYTPKHGSWLNMAEIEFSHLGRQCLDRRIPDQPTMRREVEAWVERRNQNKSKMKWRFTTDDARIKLKSLYPSIEE